MRVKAKVPQDVEQPDLLVGLFCVSCEAHRIYVLPLHKVIPRGVPQIPHLDLWAKAREALMKLDGTETEVPGHYRCEDCGIEEGDDEGPE